MELRFFFIFFYFWVLWLVVVFSGGSGGFDLGWICGGGGGGFQFEWICSGVVEGSNVVVDLLWVFWILLLWVWLGFVIGDGGGF